MSVQQKHFNVKEHTMQVLLLLCGFAVFLRFWVVADAQDVACQCQNGGSCIEGSDTCLCRNGYSGEFCDEPPVSCKTQPCENKGNCLKGYDGNFTCNCMKPYVGDFCNEASCEPEPCENGGTCLYQDGGIFCNCKSPYKGQFCTETPCDQNPCLNGACRIEWDMDEEFVCNCPPEYTGKRCENRITTPRPSRNSSTVIDITSKNTFISSTDLSSTSKDITKSDTVSSTEDTSTINVTASTLTTTTSRKDDQGKTSALTDENISSVTFNPSDKFTSTSDDEVSKKTDLSTFPSTAPKTRMVLTTVSIGFSSESLLTSISDETSIACDPDPCENGGECIETNDGIECVECKYPYRGQFCTETPCDPNPCLNGTCTITDDIEEFVCNCKPEYTGKICENRITTPRPSRNSTTVIDITSKSTFISSTSDLSSKISDKTSTEYSSDVNDFTSTFFTSNSQDDTSGERGGKTSSTEREKHTTQTSSMSTSSTSITEVSNKTTDETSASNKEVNKSDSSAKRTASYIGYGIAGFVALSSLLAAAWYIRRHRKTRILHQYTEYATSEVSIGSTDTINNLA